MKLLVVCLLVLVVSSIVCGQEESSTERSDGNDTKPANEEPPKRPRCPGSFRGFFNGDRSGGFGGFGFRRPQQPPQGGEGGRDETEYNPYGNGRRYWTPFQGRGRGGNRGPNFGGGGPNYDIPDRGDVEFV